ncbi:MAG TPA: hypothetical protein VKA18_11340 [Alphaproteobacteria bacterium]|nr:hypothetical protein [Alphaproteobacteria bacterium]
MIADGPNSKISHCVADGAWEAHTANVLETSDLVEAYAKNERLGFHIHYLWNGARRRYVPDFLIRLRSGKMMILEIKGQDSPENKQKRQALDASVEAVNQKGGFGVWCWDVVFEKGKVQNLLERSTRAGAG